MNTMIRIVVAAMALMTAGAALASGSDFNQGVEEVYPAGTADCWAYTKEPIRQMGGSVVGIGEGGIDVQGPDDPGSEQIGESAHFNPSVYYRPNGIDFNASTNIKFAVIKSGNRVAVLRYGEPNFEYQPDVDYNMQVYVPPVDDEQGVPLVIDTVNLCYAGDPASVPPPPAATIPQCSSCTAGDPTLICGIPLDQPYFGGGTNACCVCNSPALPPCNPAGAGGTPGSCVGDGSGSKTGLKVPTLLEFNKDPYVCSTSGGVRSCYRY
jgi:hypothetical protein